MASVFAYPRGGIAGFARRRAAWFVALFLAGCSTNEGSPTPGDDASIGDAASEQSSRDARPDASIDGDRNADIVISDSAVADREDTRIGSDGEGRLPDGTVDGGAADARADVS